MTCYGLHLDFGVYVYAVGVVTRALFLVITMGIYRTGRAHDLWEMSDSYFFANTVVFVIKFLYNVVHSKNGFSRPKFSNMYMHYYYTAILSYSCIIHVTLRWPLIMLACVDIMTTTSLQTKNFVVPPAATSVLYSW